MSAAVPGPFLVIAGPTGVGKTVLSLELAKLLNAEILSVDSRQIYRQLTVGTAKPSFAERDQVPHHFVDELPLGASWSAGRFAESANERIRSILNRGREPLVVGGSTLYLEALVHGISEMPVGDPEVRHALESEAALPNGPAVMLEELQRFDPIGAATLDSTKTQRLIRALEVVRMTGRPWSSFFNMVSPSPFRYIVLVLHCDRTSLYHRIEARIDQMLANGVVEENQALLSAGYRLDTNPLRTIGYAEPISYLRGEISYDTMVNRLKQNSRRYAKRQLTWYRRFKDYRWINLDELKSAGDLLSSLQ